MVQAGPATLYTIELIVNFVRTVKSDVDEGVFGERVEFDVLQSGLNNCLAGLITGGNEVDLGDAVVLQRLDGFYDVNNSTAGTNANILRRGIEMVGDSADCSIAFGGFNVCHWNDCGGEGGGAVEGNGNEDRREPEQTMARSRTRTSLLGKSAEALFKACLLFGWKNNHMLRCVACECECDTRMT